MAMKKYSSEFKSKVALAAIKGEETTKYELIYLREFESVPNLRHRLTTWLSSYNSERFHQAKSYQTPDKVYKLDLVA